MNHIVKLDCSLEGYVNIWLNKQQNKRVSGQIVESMHWIKKKNYICYCFKYLKLFYRFEFQTKKEKKGFDRKNMKNTGIKNNMRVFF